MQADLGSLILIQITPKERVYLGVKTCELFLCVVAIVRVRVYYVHFFVFFVLRHWGVSQVFTLRMSQRNAPLNNWPSFISETKSVATLISVFPTQAARYLNTRKIEIEEHSMY